ncbi:Fc receptor-like protein 2 [Discoglossus pictus]
MENYTGSYYCAVKRPGNQYSVSSDTVQITVKEQPSGVTVDLQPRDGQIVEGGSLEVTCSVDKGTGSLEFSWCNVHTGHCEIRQTSSKQHQFVVRRVMENYTGSYYCAVRRPGNQTSVRSDTVQITVKVPVTNARIIVENGVSEVKPGEILTFNCTVVRGTDPSFMWFHNDKEVNQTSGRYQIKEDGKVLYVESVQYYHGGTYMCHASNQLSPNTVPSNKLTIMVSSGTDLKQALIGSSIAVALLVLLLVCIFLLFKFRHGAASSLRNCCHKEPKAAGAMSKAAQRNTQKSESEEADGQGSQIPNDGQMEYIHLPARDLPDDDNVCYSYIDISHARKAKPHQTPAYDPYSVTYAVVKRT